MTHGTDDIGAYLPSDRLLALTRGKELPTRTHGSALFADISGFTALTSKLTRSLGLRRGAEELPRHLDRVYEALTRHVHACGGSVISFAGDAITCWFDGDSGAAATDCALGLQSVMDSFRAIALPDGSTTELALKVSVATGPVLRVVVGDPDVQLMDVIAGSTMERLASGESLARSGEVLVDQATARNLASGLHVLGWRQAAGNDFAVVGGLEVGSGQRQNAVTSSSDADLSAWLLPAVQERITAGQGEFLTELRPVVAVFVGFAGIDYDADPEAPARLDAFIRRVQDEASRLDGSLLQLTVGDKGSYLYLAFGAPVSNEDDARRAVTFARRLLHVPGELPWITSLHIGMSQGTMRTGAYGGHLRRTYGALGDETNMAARLMGKAESGRILASEAVVRACGGSVNWARREPVMVKGRSTPLPVFEPQDDRLVTVTAQDLGPLAGRVTELAQLQELLDSAAAGAGRTLRLLGDAGIGKTRLVRAFTESVADQVELLAGEAESLTVDVPYQPWRRVFEQVLGLTGDRSAGALAAALERLAPDLLPRLPLLGPVLGLSLADNSLTVSLDSELRKTSREEMLVELLRLAAGNAASRGRTLLLVLENEQWFDPLSRDLLQQLQRLADKLPLLALVSGRVVGKTDGEVLRLRPLSEAAARELLRARLSGRQLPEAVLRRILRQAEGNPYYLEELTGFLLEQDVTDGQDPELPASLHSLILSRLDRLSEHQKATLKAASVLGQSFRLDWLSGYHPSLGGMQRVRREVAELARQGITGPAGSDALTWLFRQLITRDVSYESIPFAVRSSLHERLARHIERHYASDNEPMLELLALHYSYGEDVDKQREYLLRAGVAAQDSYANEAALRWFRQLLPLVEPSERAELLQRQGQVQVHLGEYPDADASYRQALQEAPDDHSRARSMRLLGELQEKQGNYGAALDWLEQARGLLNRTGDNAELIQVLLAEGGNVLWQQGEYDLALERLQLALQLATELHDARSVARALHGLGNIELYQGNLERAQQLFQESLATRRQLGDSLGIANALNNLGIIAASLTGADLARDLFTESLEIRRAIGDRAGTAVALNNVGFMAAELGDSGTAVAHYSDSLRLRREIGDRLGEAVTLNSLGHMQWRSGDRPAAAASYGESLQLAADIGNSRELAAALAGAGAVVSRQDADLARRLSGAARAILAGLGAATEPEVQELLDAVQLAGSPEQPEADPVSYSREVLLPLARELLASMAG